MMEGGGAAPSEVAEPFPTETSLRARAVLPVARNPAVILLLLFLPWETESAARTAIWTRRRRIASATTDVTIIAGDAGTPAAAAAAAAAVGVGAAAGAVNVTHRTIDRVEIMITATSDAVVAQRLQWGLRLQWGRRVQLLRGRRWRWCGRRCPGAPQQRLTVSASSSGAAIARAAEGTSPIANGRS